MEKDEKNTICFFFHNHITLFLFYFSQIHTLFIKNMVLPVFLHPILFNTTRISLNHIYCSVLCHLYTLSKFHFFSMHIYCVYKLKYKKISLKVFIVGNIQIHIIQPSQLGYNIPFPSVSRV